MLRHHPAPSGATWLTAWALALAIASTILIISAADGRDARLSPSHAASSARTR